MILRERTRTRITAWYLRNLHFKRPSRWEAIKRVNVQQNHLTREVNGPCRPCVVQDRNQADGAVRIFTRHIDMTPGLWMTSLSRSETVWPGVTTCLRLLHTFAMRDRAAVATEGCFAPSRHGAI